MAVECCGKSRETPFCPQCGKQVGSKDGLGGLLVYCRSNAKLFLAQHKRWMRRAERDPERAGAHKTYAEGRLRAALKWQGWAESLEEFLASKE